MYWAVMPFWYFSVAKLWESTEFVLALLPKAEKGSLLDAVTAGSKKRLGKMTPDAATLTYVSLNAFAAIFDNAYMALYTALGPEQFWHTSQAFNDADFHLRLVKGTTGSLTVALLIFISTLGWRKQMSMDLAIWLNVILGSVGPWIVLFWHKLVDPSEDWFPQFVFDPAYDYHPLWQTATQIVGGTETIGGIIQGLRWCHRRARVTLCVISVLVVSIPRAAIPKTASSFHPSLRKESAMAESGAEIWSRGAVRGAGEMTDAAPIALASGEVAVGRQKWVRRSLWLAGGVGVVSLLAAGYWEELKELNAYGQLYLRAPPPHESVRVRTGESDASMSSHPPSGAPPGRRARPRLRETRRPSRTTATMPIRPRPPRLR